MHLGLLPRELFLKALNLVHHVRIVISLSVNLVFSSLESVHDRPFLVFLRTADRLYLSLDSQMLILLGSNLFLDALKLTFIGLFEGRQFFIDRSLDLCLDRGVLVSDLVT